MLLVLLLIYDIFFVFITPLFSAGKSIMVEVATGKIFFCSFKYFVNLVLAYYRLHVRCLLHDEGEVYVLNANIKFCH